MRCPVCHVEGTLDARGQDLIIQADELTHLVSGQRTCPNPKCRALVFVIYDRQDGEMAIAYPPERIDFDASGLPDPVKEALTEAVTCHAQGCYAAGAVMVRRALEGVCADQKTTGDNLYERIEDLGTKIVLPKGMIDSLHNLRLLGNDAAHVEARVYQDVGQREVEVAIDVAKVILQATYQLESVLGQLEELKGDAGT
jgi:hypothetical protein